MQNGEEIVTRQTRRYRSYLLRMWQTNDGKEQLWRASLESPGTGERRGFANLKDLFEFLDAQADQPSAHNTQDDQLLRR